MRHSSTFSPTTTRSTSVLLAAVLLGAAAVVNAEHGSEMRRQAGGAGMGRGHGGVEKRQGSNARMTYYYTDVGPGACGQVHQNNEYTVAMNTAQFNGGGVCGQTVTINYNGNTASALVADECPSCGYGQLDLSPGLFQHFADFGAGEIYGSWSYGSGSPPPAPDPPKPSPTPTTAAPEPEYTPTTTTHKQKTTTTQEPDPTTTSTSTSEYVAPSTTSAAPTTSSAAPETTSISASVATSSEVASASATASALPTSSSGNGSDGTDTSGGVLVALGQAVAGLGGMVCKGNGGCVAE